MNNQDNDNINLSNLDALWQNVKIILVSFNEIIN